MNVWKEVASAAKETPGMYFGPVQSFAKTVRGLFISLCHGEFIDLCKLVWVIIRRGK